MSKGTLISSSTPQERSLTNHRADGRAKRGRGRGRGGISRGTGRAVAAKDGPAGATKLGTVRKPRVTKAAKQQMEQEKVQRENMAILAAKPSTFPA